jgi:AP-2 complex subunit beta-1
VKLFIFKPASEHAKTLVYKVLKWATEEADNPDLRDRGFMYWRMLAIAPAVAGSVVLAEKPAITTDSDRMDRGALDQLLLHTGTIASIYHKNPEVRRAHACTRTRRLTHAPDVHPRRDAARTRA